MNNSPTLTRLLVLLSDGEWHSGEDLGAALQISRAAVSKQIKHLAELGIELESLKGVGYRAEAFELLDQGDIREALGMEAAHHLRSLQVHQSISSTNQALLDELQSGADIHGHVCLAERQTQGRGRRGRNWYSPFAKNLYVSVGWNFEGGVAEIEGLSLAVGIVLCQALEKLGFKGASLKWPNDILVDEKKLGGILIELGGDAISNCVVVVGVGLNVAMDKVSDSVDQPWDSLKNKGVNFGRNVLATEMIEGLFAMFESYSVRGFRSYQDEWNKRSAFSGQNVSVSTLNSVVEGRMLGVGEHGQLLIDVVGETRSFYGGEVSLRARR